MSEAIGIIGAGKWGQGLRYAFAQANEDVRITSRSPKEIPGFTTLDRVLECPLLVIALPVQIADAWMKTQFRYGGQEVLIASKGIEVATGRFLNQVYEAYVPKEKLSFLSGPSFAAEVIKGLPTALVVTAQEDAVAHAFMTRFPGFIKTYRSSDIIGSEIAGAYKNVIAIAAGVSDALGLGNNARAAMITRGLAEMTRFGVAFGAQIETFLGLSGVGDLFLTASSTLSRNYRVGFGLGSGKTLDTILKELGEVAEGVPTTGAVVAKAQEVGLYVPIAKEVQAILEGKDPKASLARLLERRKEEEF